MDEIRVRVFYHLAWTVKDQLPALTPEVETLAIKSIRHKTARLRSPIWAIGAAYDHIHIVVSIPLDIIIHDWIASVKAFSASQINAAYPDLNPHFQWQREYALQTLDQTMLSFVLPYVENQKQHHADDTLDDDLEILAMDE